MKKKGFTLMELIITLTIVIILSLISWPIYRGHRSKEYTTLAEGYALLGVIKEAQINYYNEYGYFLKRYLPFPYNTFNDPVLGINAINNKYFSLFTYWNDWHETGDQSYKHYFDVTILSNDASITQKYNLTERFDMVVSGKTAIKI
ncbi:MAG: prepilin-type N-terminal cleavage/methylation domain-containing protein [Elusimicrobia bacterium]|nr:prepilin-type N-terminal cleavage/methylation domain-containing protein [Elusimicrobiota bacterium]